ncbi:MAG: N-acetyltransferase [Novosphingobium sp.]|nr:N-acetyltransferase [Novosphingobium sp.]
MDLTIGPASEADARACAAIYAHHVLHGTATYDLEPPTAEVFSARIAKVHAAGWPWLVARERGDVLGFAYATQFRDRPGYRFACEDSIYVREDRRGEGIGAALLAALVGACSDAGFRQMFAVIGGAEPASAALHNRAGFRTVGRLEAIGRKHGRWLDSLYMQRALGEGSSTSPEVEPG